MTNAVQKQLENLLAALNGKSCEGLSADLDYWKVRHYSDPERIQVSLGSLRGKAKTNATALADDWLDRKIKAEYAQANNGAKIRRGMKAYQQRYAARRQEALAWGEQLYSKHREKVDAELNRLVQEVEQNTDAVLHWANEIERLLQTLRAFGSTRPYEERELQRAVELRQHAQRYHDRWTEALREITQQLAEHETDGLTQEPKPPNQDTELADGFKVGDRIIDDRLLYENRFETETWRADANRLKYGTVVEIRRWSKYNISHCPYVRYDDGSERFQRGHYMFLWLDDFQGLRVGDRVTVIKPKHRLLGKTGVIIGFRRKPTPGQFSIALAMDGHEVADYFLPNELTPETVKQPSIKKSDWNDRKRHELKRLEIEVIRLEGLAEATATDRWEKEIEYQVRHSPQGQIILQNIIADERAKRLGQITTLQRKINRLNGSASLNKNKERCELHQELGRQQSLISSVARRQLKQLGLSQQTEEGKQKLSELRAQERAKRKPELDKIQRRLVELEGNPMSNQLRYLLIVPNSPERVKSVETMPAIDRYNAPVHQVLRQFAVEHQIDWKSDDCPVELWILSSKYGLVPARMKVRSYEREMNPEVARSLQARLRSELNAISQQRTYEDIYLYLPPAHQESLGDIGKWFPHATLIAAPGDNTDSTLEALELWLEKIFSEATALVSPSFGEPYSGEIAINDKITFSLAGSIAVFEGEVREIADDRLIVASGKFDNPVAIDRGQVHSKEQVNLSHNWQPGDRCWLSGHVDFEDKEPFFPWVEGVITKVEAGDCVTSCPHCRAGECQWVWVDYSQQMTDQTGYGVDPKHRPTFVSELKANNGTLHSTVHTKACRLFTDKPEDRVNPSSASGVSNASEIDPPLLTTQRRIIIGDVHGHYEALTNLLEFVNLEVNDQVYFLGDLIDRGPDSAKVINLIRDRGYISLMGNHEQLMLEAIEEFELKSKEGKCQRLWLQNGGTETLCSYVSNTSIADTFQALKASGDLEWLQSLPLCLDLGDIFLVHGGLRPEVPLEKQTKRDMLWIREEFHEHTERFFADKIVICGHRLTFTHPDGIVGEIVQGSGWINIETGVYHSRSGWLTAFDWNNQQIFQVNANTGEKRTFPYEPPDKADKSALFWLTECPIHYPKFKNELERASIKTLQVALAQMQVNPKRKKGCIAAIQRQLSRKEQEEFSDEPLQVNPLASDQLSEDEGSGNQDQRRIDNRVERCSTELLDAVSGDRSSETLSTSVAVVKSGDNQNSGEHRLEFAPRANSWQRDLWFRSLTQLPVKDEVFQKHLKECDLYTIDLALKQLDGQTGVKTRVAQLKKQLKVLQESAETVQVEHQHWTGKLQPDPTQGIRLTIIAWNGMQQWERHFPDTEKISEVVDWFKQQIDLQMLDPDNPVFRGSRDTQATIFLHRQIDDDAVKRKQLWESLQEGDRVTLNTLPKPEEIHFLETKPTAVGQRVRVWMADQPLYHNKMAQVTAIHEDGSTFEVRAEDDSFSGAIFDQCYLWVPTRTVRYNELTNETVFWVERLTPGLWLSYQGSEPFRAFASWIERVLPPENSVSQSHSLSKGCDATLVSESHEPKPEDLHSTLERISWTPYSSYASVELVQAAAKTYSADLLSGSKPSIRGLFEYKDGSCWVAVAMCSYPDSRADYDHVELVKAISSEQWQPSMKTDDLYSGREITYRRQKWTLTGDRVRLHIERESHDDASTQGEELERGDDIAATGQEVSGHDIGVLCCGSEPGQDQDPQSTVLAVCGRPDKNSDPQSIQPESSNNIPPVILEQAQAQLIASYELETPAGNIAIQIFDSSVDELVFEFRGAPLDPATYPDCEIVGGIHPWDLEDPEEFPSDIEKVREYAKFAAEDYLKRFLLALDREATTIQKIVRKYVRSFGKERAASVLTDVFNHGTGVADTVALLEQCRSSKDKNHSEQFTLLALRKAVLDELIKRGLEIAVDRLWNYNTLSWQKGKDIAPIVAKLEVGQAIDVVEVDGQAGIAFAVEKVKPVQGADSKSSESIKLSKRPHIADLVADAASRSTVDEEIHHGGVRYRVVHAPSFQETIVFCYVGAAGHGIKSKLEAQVQGAIVVIGESGNLTIQIPGLHEPGEIVEVIHAIAVGDQADQIADLRFGNVQLAKEILGRLTISEAEETIREIDDLYAAEQGITTIEAQTQLPLGSVVHVKDEYDTYIGRKHSRTKNKLPQSDWHNPFVVGKDGTLEEVLQKFETYFLSKTQLIERLGELRGKRIACWCCEEGKELGPDDPLQCHGQIYLKALRGDYNAQFNEFEVGSFVRHEPPPHYERYPYWMVVEKPFADVALADLWYSIVALDDYGNPTDFKIRSRAWELKSVTDPRRISADINTLCYLCDEPGVRGVELSVGDRIMTRDMTEGDRLGVVLGFGFQGFDSGSPLVKLDHSAMVEFHHAWEPEAGWLGIKRRDLFRLTRGDAASLDSIYTVVALYWHNGTIGATTPGTGRQLFFPVDAIEVLPEVVKEVDRQFSQTHTRYEFEIDGVRYRAEQVYESKLQVFDSSKMPTVVSRIEDGQPMLWNCHEKQQLADLEGAIVLDAGVQLIGNQFLEAALRVHRAIVQSLNLTDENMEPHKVCKVWRQFGDHWTYTGQMGYKHTVELREGDIACPVGEDPNLTSTPVVVEDVNQSIRIAPPLLAEQPNLPGYQTVWVTSLKTSLQLEEKHYKVGDPQFCWIGYSPSTAEYKHGNWNDADWEVLRSHASFFHPPDFIYHLRDESQSPSWLFVNLAAWAYTQAELEAFGIDVSSLSEFEMIEVPPSNWSANRAISDELKKKTSSTAHTPELQGMDTAIYTPDKITELPGQHIFVFGSNLQGRHGKGAAKLAYEKFGARYGEATGLQGQSYAIYTKDLEKGSRSVTPLMIKFQLQGLISFAIRKPNLTFWVTQIGTGEAGYTVSEIGELFADLEIPTNVILPRSFAEFNLGYTANHQQEVEAIPQPQDAQLPELASCEAKRFLLIIGCSGQKVVDAVPIPAIRRYFGPMYKMLAKLLDTGSLPQGVELDIWILSAEYGLIPASQEIPNYDRRMTPERAIELRPQVNAKLQELLTQPYQSIYIDLGKDYLPALGEEVPVHASITWGAGAIGQRISKVKRWIETLGENTPCQAQSLQAKIHLARTCDRQALCGANGTSYYLIERSSPMLLSSNLVCPDCYQRYSLAIQPELKDTQESAPEPASEPIAVEVVAPIESQPEYRFEPIRRNAQVFQGTLF